MKRVIYRLMLIRAASISIGIAVIAMILCLSSCNDSDKWEEVPQEINDFVTRYYPGVAYSSYTTTSDGYRVRLRNGPGINFDKSYDWTSLNGYGMPLPQIFLFDCMPPALYQYLEDNQILNDIFSATRDSKTYSLETIENVITYEISTGEITEKSGIP